MTDSNGREEKKIGIQPTTGRGTVSVGTEQGSEQPEVKPTDFHRFDHTEESSESQERVGEVAFDDDPRVNIGLNRLIDMIVNRPHSKLGVGVEDD